MASGVHKGNTGKITKVTLPSAIELVQWKRLVAAPGGSAGLEVRTRFVGNGAKLQIDLTDGSGKKHGTFRDAISGNVFWCEIAVPPAARDALVATVKLPDHGLEMTGAALLLTPPIEIVRPEWDRTEVKRGEIVKLAADVKGAADGTEAEIAILEHDADGVHDPVTQFTALVQGERVEVDWEFAYVEDTDDVPTDPELEGGYQHPEYFFRVTVGGIQAESPTMKFADDFEIALVDDLGRAVGKADYLLTLADGSERRGTLKADGTASEADVPPGPVEVSFPGIEDRDEPEGV